MSEQAFKKGEHVFEQGDEGTAFYVITHGEASVLRTDEGQSEPHELARLQELGKFLGGRGEGVESAKRSCCCFGAERAGFRLFRVPWLKLELTLEVFSL